MRTKLPLVVLAVIVLAGVFLWTFVGTTDGHAARLEEGAASLDTPAVPLAPPKPADAGELEASPSASRDAVAPEVAAPSPGERPQPTGIEIVPVVGAERRRVAEAEVWWIEGTENEHQWADPTFDEWLKSGRFEERMAGVAVRLEQDSEQRLRLPRPALVGAVVGRTEDLWGLLRVTRASRQLTYLQLEADIELTARVLDASGDPVEGVQVAIRQDCGEGCRVDHAVVATDADGFARFRHYRALMNDDWDYDAIYGFSIAEPLVEPVRVEFDPTQPPSELTTLVLPPTGSVVLQLGPKTTARKARLELRRPEERFDENTWYERFFDGEREVVDGVVHFPFVGLGRDVIPQTVYGATSKREDASRKPGPTRAGEEVRLEIAAAAKRMTLRARLLDETGAPLRQQRIQVYLESRDQDLPNYGNTTWHTTDGEGNLELRFDRSAEGRTTLDLIQHADSIQPLARSRSVFEWPEGQPEHSLGDVRLTALALFADGRVVDGQGIGIPDASITVWMPMSNPGPASNRPAWTRHGTRLRCDSNGQFTLRGDLRTDRVMLVAAAERATSRPLLVRLGERGVTLTTEPAGVVRGQLVAAPGMSFDHLQVEARREETKDPNVPATSPLWDEPDTEGQFRLRGALAGHYTVRVHLAGIDAPIATVAGVRVDAGEESSDSRLEPLDLRQVGRWRNLKVLDADGTPARYWLVVRPRPPGAEFPVIDWHSGPVARYESAEPPFWVCSLHSLAELVDPVAVGDSIRLSPAPQLRIVTADDVPWPAEGSLSLRVFGANHDDVLERSLDNFPHDLKPGAPLEVRGRRLGPLQANLTYTATRSVELPCEIVRGGVLAATSGVHVLEIRWTQDALDKALAEARD